NQQVSKTGLPRARDREPSQQRGARWRTVMGEDSAAGSKVRFSALIPKRMSHERCVAILRRLLLRRIFETQRPRRSYAVGVGLGRLRERLAKGESVTALATEYGVSRQTVYNYKTVRRRYLV